MRTKVKALTAVLVLVSTLSVVGCYSAPVMPPVGIFYNDTTAPMAFAGKEFGSKKGTATATSWFGVVSTGDCSISAAAKNGGITTVKHTDYHFSNIFFYQRFTTIVYGD